MALIHQYSYCKTSAIVKDICTNMIQNLRGNSFYSSEVWSEFLGEKTCRNMRVCIKPFVCSMMLQLTEKITDNATVIQNMYKYTGTKCLWHVCPSLSVRRWKNAFYFILSNQRRIIITEWQHIMTPNLTVMCEQTTNRQAACVQISLFWWAIYAMNS